VLPAGMKLNMIGPTRASIMSLSLKEA